MIFIKKIFVVFLALSLSACTSSVSKTDVATQPEPTVAIAKTTLDPKEDACEWLLNATLGGGPGEDEMFLTRLDDSTGESYTSVQELVNILQTDEEREDSEDSYLSMGKLNRDGSRLAVYRWWDGEEQSIVEIYDLQEGKKVQGFDMPGDLLDISTDLTHYFYEQEGQFYVYDSIAGQELNIRLEQDHAVEAIHEDRALDRYRHGKFSPDHTRISFPAANNGIVVTNIQKGTSEVILTDRKISSIVQWDDSEQLIYTVNEHEDSFLCDIYVLDRTTGQSQRIGAAEDSFVLSPDHMKMIEVNQELVKIFLVNLQNDVKRDITSTVNGHGNWTYPEQWIKSNVNYMEYLAAR